MVPPLVSPVASYECILNFSVALWPYCHFAVEGISNACPWMKFWFCSQNKGFLSALSFGAFKIMMKRLILSFKSISVMLVSTIQMKATEKPRGVVYHSVK